jgi:hypothetical protein
MYYYVIRHYSENGTRKTPANYPYATRAEAERQYALLVAAAWANEIALQEGKEMNIDFESVEIGTVEQGKIDRRYFAHVRPIPEEAVTEEA